MPAASLWCESHCALRIHCVQSDRQRISQGSVMLIVRKQAAIGTVSPSALSSVAVIIDFNPGVHVLIFKATLVGKIPLEYSSFKPHKRSFNAAPCVIIADVKYSPVWNAVKSDLAVSAVVVSIPVMYAISLMWHVLSSSSELPMYLSNIVLAWCNRSCSSSKVRCCASYCCKMTLVTSCSHRSNSRYAACITDRRSFTTESLPTRSCFISDSIWWTALWTLLLVTQVIFIRSCNIWRWFATTSLRLTMMCPAVLSWSTTVQSRQMAALQVSQKKKSGWLPWR